MLSLPKESLGARFAAVRDQPVIPRVPTMTANEISSTFAIMSNRPSVQQSSLVRAEHKLKVSLICGGVIFQQNSRYLETA